MLRYLYPGSGPPPLSVLSMAPAVFTVSTRQICITWRLPHAPRSWLSFGFVTTIVHLHVHNFLLLFLVFLLLFLTVTCTSVEVRL